MSKEIVKRKTAAKKKPVKQHEIPEVVPPATPKQEVKPGFWVYLKAIRQLIFAWAKAHKYKSLGIILLTFLVLGGLFIMFRPGQSPPTNDEIVIQVNKEQQIQGDGNPVILTVEDKTKATQPFLQQAENGDKVLLYYKAKKSILYRPSEKRIVHQGAYTPPEAKVFIRKGTNESRPVDQVKDTLETVEDITLASEDASQRNDYKGVTIVHVTDRYDEKVQELASALNAQVVRMPAGESFPDADILIIVGN